MTWTCPHQTGEDSCDLRKKECKPGAKGCVLAQKFKFVSTDMAGDSAQ